MRVPFRKMHGLGNDFVVLDRREGPGLPLEPAIIAALSDRHTGIGCDQLILLEPSEQAEFAMRIYNCDGSEAEACGNAARAVALLTAGKTTIDTSGGSITVEPTSDGAVVNMGRPRFDWTAIPLSRSLNGEPLPRWADLPAPDFVNVGNPHAVFFVETMADIDAATLGALIERDDLFPQRINVNFAEVTSTSTIELVVWERGAGLTRACGTGACATAVAALRRGLVESPVNVRLPGGSLRIAWRPDEDILMAGPASEAFRGDFEWEDYA